MMDEVCADCDVAVETLVIGETVLSDLRLIDTGAVSGNS